MTEGGSEAPTPPLGEAIKWPRRRRQNIHARAASDGFRDGARYSSSFNLERKYSTDIEVGAH